MILLPSKDNGRPAISISSSVILLRVKGINQLEVAKKIDHPSTIISDALSISKEQEEFAMLQHDGSRISLKVKFNNDLRNEILKETLQLDSHRGNVEKAFINIYTRTDRTHGFRILLIIEDHSLLLVQQGEIFWSREDGLASILILLHLNCLLRRKVFQLQGWNTIFLSGSRYTFDMQKPHITFFVKIFTIIV